MYPIEINLLRERSGFKDDIRGGATGPMDNTPLLIGGAFGVAAIGLVLLAAAGLTFRKQQLVTQEQQLADELTKIVPQLNQVEQLKQQEQQINAETAALTTIFNQIKPWAATLQDIRDRVPAELQLVKLEQAAPPAPAASPSPAPSPAASPAPSPAPTAAPNNQGATPPPPAATELTISGKARSFSDINDFVLALQNSPFLDSEATRLILSQRVDPRSAKAGEAGVSLVDYQIRTSISGVPAVDLLQELRQKGASGLVARIDFLKQKGAIGQTSSEVKP